MVNKTHWVHFFLIFSYFLFVIVLNFYTVNTDLIVIFFFFDLFIETLRLLSLEENTFNRKIIKTFYF